MNPSKSTELSEEEITWMEDYLSGSISEEQFSKMQDHLAAHPGYRRELRKFLAMDNYLFAKWDGIEIESTDLWAPEKHTEIPDKTNNFHPTLIAALLGLLATSATILFFTQKREKEAVAANLLEATAEGFAVLRNLSDAEWGTGTPTKFVGNTLNAERIHLLSGMAEIQFFSGANMILEGPSEVILKSAWEAECKSGNVRMQVPPAARGFTLHAPETEIIDLGTEFGLTVAEGESQVAVFDGEIEFRHRSGETRHVSQGGAWKLPAGAEEATIPLERSAFPKSGSFVRSNPGQLDQSFSKWKSYRDRLANDDRLIAYYTFEPTDSSIPDLANTETGEQQGTVILAETVPDRWENRKSALDFKKPGSRVRVNLQGEFSAYTFLCWVRIDSLDRKYNALFLGDGYENGEPHWQIRNDGKLMLSVMIDDTASSVYPNDKAGRHHVYFSPPIWDLSMSGNWMHIVSVYDPAHAKVKHFVDGEKVAELTMAPNDVVSKLKIGNGEIGNWGQPFRTDPTFAIRNLNGRMSEFAVFDAALTETEIISLYEQSKTEK